MNDPEEVARVLLDMERNLQKNNGKEAGRS
jgi:hypothetical protein